MAQVCASPFLLAFAPLESAQIGKTNLSRTAFHTSLLHAGIPKRLHSHARTIAPSASLRKFDANSSEEREIVAEDDVLAQTIQLQDLLLASGALITPLLLDVEPASAAGGDFGILEGRSLALLHPIVMAGLFFYTLYAGYLGWQWRRTRTLAGEISDLKKQIPEAAEGAPPSPLQLEVDKLSEERKALVKGGFRDKHFNAGSILLGGGITIAVGGCLNTWLRTGKLFPGPHLFAGAAITVLWAMAAALVPAMQKGDENARSAHIALNALNVALFVWQIPTGIDIVYKVFQFTSWP